MINMSQVTLCYTFQTNQSDNGNLVSESRNIPNLSIRNGGVASLARSTSGAQWRSPPSQPKPGDEAFSKMAAILLLNEDAKVVDGILKMGRQPTHGINLEDNPHVPRH